MGLSSTIRTIGMSSPSDCGSASVASGSPTAACGVRVAVRRAGVAGVAHRLQQLGAVERLGNIRRRRLAGPLLLVRRCSRSRPEWRPSPGRACSVSRTSQPLRPGIRMSSRMASGLHRAGDLQHRRGIGQDRAVALLEQQPLGELQKRRSSSTRRIASSSLVLATVPATGRHSRPCARRPRLAPCATSRPRRPRRR